MTGLGTIVNIGAILAGCLVGMLLKGGLPKRLQDTISSAVGLCVVCVAVIHIHLTRPTKREVWISWVAD